MISAAGRRENISGELTTSKYVKKRAIESLLVLILVGLVVGLLSRQSAENPSPTPTPVELDETYLVGEWKASLMGGDFRLHFGEDGALSVGPSSMMYHGSYQLSPRSGRLWNLDLEYAQKKTETLIEFYPPDSILFQVNETSPRPEGSWGAKSWSSFAKNRPQLFQRSGVNPVDEHCEERFKPCSNDVANSNCSS